MGSKVAIVGTGLIGRGWAVAFARAGWDVALWDANAAAAESALTAVRDAIEDMAGAGLLSRAEDAKQRVRRSDSITDALSGVAYVQESVPERVEVKRDAFEALDAAAPSDAIIGSSTSTIAGSLFLADIPGRARCIVAHPANPPHLMPVVEIVPSPWHDQEMVERTRDILASIGQVPVVVKKEIEGFVMNRLQTAVVNEAVALVADGVIEPDDLDAVMKHSLGLRWAFMGPFETMDLNAPLGFLDYATRYGHLYQRMGNDLMVTRPWPGAVLEKIEASRRRETPKASVDRRMRWRDRALMRLLALKNDIDSKAGSGES